MLLAAQGKKLLGGEDDGERILLKKGKNRATTGRGAVTAPPYSMIPRYFRRQITCFEYG